MISALPSPVRLATKHVCSSTRQPCTGAEVADNCLAEGGATAIVVTKEHVILPEADDITSLIAIVVGCICELQLRQYRINRRS